VAGPVGLTEAVVGRVGRPHGVRGEVSVEVRTDEPALRFAVGAVLRPTRGQRRSLTVRTVRPHGDRLLVTFADITDRTAAESLRGAELVVDVEPDTRPDDAEEFYDRQLIGLRVRRSGGPAADPSRAAGTGTESAASTDEIGTVVEVRHLPAQDLLEIRLDADPDTGAGAAEPVLVPFVRDLVPVVDLDGGWLLVRAVPGLLDPDAEPEGDPDAAPTAVPGDGAGPTAGRG